VSGMSTALRTYYRGAGLVSLRETPAAAPAATRVYHFDHQGTTQCLTDTATGIVTDRYSADAWGVKIQQTGASLNRHWYIGDWGYCAAFSLPLYYVRARFYAPRAASWMTSDPILLLYSGTGSYGRYGYADSEPSNKIDPSGLWPWQLRCAGNGFQKCVNVIKDVTTVTLEVPSDDYFSGVSNGSGNWSVVGQSITLYRNPPSPGNGASPIDCTKSKVFKYCSPLCRSFTVYTNIFEQERDPLSRYHFRKSLQCKSVWPRDCDDGQNIDFTGSLAAIVGVINSALGVAFSIALDVWKAGQVDCKQNQWRPVFTNQVAVPDKKGKGNRYYSTYRITAKRDIVKQWHCCCLEGWSSETPN
jgi:RHS repeat-associated protein